MRDTLETERLILRPFKFSDAEEMFSNWANDPEVTKYMTWLPHENVTITQQIINFWIKEYEKPQTIRFGITLKDSGALIGSIDVVDFINGKPEIGYCLSRKYWNHGYMTEACKAVMDYIFSLGYDEVLIRAQVENIGSNKVIQKCGFKFLYQESGPSSEVKPEIITVNYYSKKKE